MRKQKPSVPTDEGTGAATGVTQERLAQIGAYTMDGTLDRENLAYGLGGGTAVVESTYRYEPGSRPV